MNEDYWRAIAEEMGEELGVDTREGSVYMDAQAGSILRTSKFYGDLAQIQAMISPLTCTGDILEQYAEMDGLTRILGTPSYWKAIFEGATPEDGTRFMCGNIYLTWYGPEENEEYGYLKADSVGTFTNSLIPGTQIIPVINIEGLTTALLGDNISAGTDAETDEDLRSRWREEKANPAGNSNRQQYKTWCENISGVALARILPLWGGACTVRAVLISANGTGADSDVVATCQQYIDPIEDGYIVTVGGVAYTFGDGVGEGVSNIGAHFLATAAAPYNIVVSAGIILKNGYTVEQAEAEAEDALALYFKELSLNGGDQTVVRMSTIASLFSALNTIEDYDYDTLKINGGSNNITIDVLSVPIISEVVFSV
ncbi:MAG: baseplate J/gp47 family protein [Lachnospiraceae bacterium]|nr:baseplate J/gp47 family protein [Lachnospiraceae bacterium]